MRHDMFEDVVAPNVTVGTRRWYTVPVSAVTHLLIVAVLVIVPLTASGVLPMPQSVLAFAVPAPVASPPPPPALPPSPVLPDTVVSANPELAPLSAPDRITAEAPPTALTVTIAPVAGLTTSAPAVALRPAAPPVVASPPQPSGPVPVGGAVGEPRKILHVPPIYPAVARSARRDGTVIIEATIAKDGSVRAARVLRSSGLFDQAALDAVRQWRYTTPTLNGIPVDVTMTVTVHFLLE